MESSDIKSPAGRKSPKVLHTVLCLCNRSFLLFFSSFLFYIRLFASEFLGIFFSHYYHSFWILRFAAAHTLMGRVWLICCRTISWLLSGLFLLCPGSVPPSRSRSLPTQSHTGQGDTHFKLKIQLIITVLNDPIERGFGPKSTWVSALLTVKNNT